MSEEHQEAIEVSEEDIERATVAILERAVARFMVAKKAGTYPGSETALGFAVTECAIEIARSRVEIESLQHTFVVRWQADMRAIGRWRKAHPGNDLRWPDHADMVVWLLEQIEAKDNK